ncbi:organic cation transporter-like protein [Babylonia areolata]|uniref:organic cation transporter-like protein n=1 Tax=Babylonia areolata TaxID=304850 RepID=UPI003FD5AF06
MSGRGNTDSCLRTLGSVGRYQILQVLVVTIGSVGASYQLMGNIFVGRHFTRHHCSRPDNDTMTSEGFPDIDWNSSDVTYGQCQIVVSSTNGSEKDRVFPCLFGYSYDFDKRLSFRTEIDQVCQTLTKCLDLLCIQFGLSRYSLSSASQFGTFIYMVRVVIRSCVNRQVILSVSRSFLCVRGCQTGQFHQVWVVSRSRSRSPPSQLLSKVKVGRIAVESEKVSCLSPATVLIRLFMPQPNPRYWYGRKPVLVASQLALMTLGLAAGFVPNYAGLAALKFIIGVFQQGVITPKSTMSIEWFPSEKRSLANLVAAVMWSFCMMSLSLIAFLMQHHTWRHLQVVLSAASAPVFLLQLWYLDESLRWLLVNNRKKKVVSVLQRAARLNRKDLSTVLSTVVLFSSSPTQPESKALTKGEVDRAKNTSSTVTSDVDTMAETGGKEESQKLTLVDIFRHRRLLVNAAIMWIAWFTCAFSFFALYMMSVSLHGDRFINYFLSAVMELFPSILFFFLVDRLGRRTSSRPFYLLAGLALVSSGVCRIFADSPALRTTSVVTAMLGLFGASGMFSAAFFYTPELFPTNIRNQALGVASLAGRFGGMLSPFMVDLAEVAVWAPGAIIGSLCFMVVVLMHFLPETKGRELPNTLQDIDEWYLPLPTSQPQEQPLAAFHREEEEGGGGL